MDILSLSPPVASLIGSMLGACIGVMSVAVGASLNASFNRSRDRALHKDAMRAKAALLTADLSIRRRKIGDIYKAAQYVPSTGVMVWPDLRFLKATSIPDLDKFSGLSSEVIQKCVFGYEAILDLISSFEYHSLITDRVTSERPERAELVVGYCKQADRSISEAIASLRSY